jgi:hypothetical protein
VTYQTLAPIAESANEIAIIGMAEKVVSSKRVIRETAECSIMMITGIAAVTTIAVRN